MSSIQFILKNANSIRRAASHSVADSECIVHTVNLIITPHVQTNKKTNTVDCT